MKTYSRVYAKIDLDAIEYNMEQMRKNTSENTKIIAVIKTDGYGHGAVPIAEMLETFDYIWGYAVATLDEAVVLRFDGIAKPILVLGCIFPDQYMEMLQHEIRMNVYTEEMAQSISAVAVQEGKTAYIHIKLDTGMARLGFSVNEENISAIKRISQLPNICMEGVFTHFAKADEIDKTFTNKQIEDYLYMVTRLKEEGITFAYEHCSNSAGIIDVPEANMDLVRAGIAIYGLYPSEEVDKTVVALKPSLELKSHVAFVKEIAKGTAVSYGGTFVAPMKMMVATIPVGYGDGYPRSLSNKGYVLIRGKKAPIIGR
ncbi:MAG: alanine racemase, partial [Lachnospiraceae bacterium]